MAYLPVAQDTPWQKGTGVDPTRTAVLVVDVLGGADGPTPGLEEMAKNVVRIVRAARGKGLPVIFADDAHLPGIDRELALWGEHGVAGTEGSRPVDALEAGSGERDYIVPKRRYDAFFGTDLDLTLRELGVDTLVTVGCDTNICVLHTLAGAFFRGYRTVVAADACATFLIGTQEAGLEYFARCYDARVVDTQTVLGYLA